MLGTLLRGLSMISTSWYFLPSVILSSWVQSGPSDWLLVHQICKNYEKSHSILGYKRLKFILPYSLLPFSFLFLKKSAAILWAPLWNIPNDKKTERSCWATVHEKQIPQSNNLWKSKPYQQSLGWGWKWTQS